MLGEGDCAGNHLPEQRQHKAYMVKAILPKPKSGGSRDDSGVRVFEEPFQHDVGYMSASPCTSSSWRTVHRTAKDEMGA